MTKAVKKGATTALQTEVTTNEEWDQVRSRKGLVVVDVYSAWSGPCSAMISTLRKLKMEIGGDVLSYALARNDEISSLERFRGRSEPVWMFLQNGKIVNLVFGAHCPNLRRTIVSELERVQEDGSPKRFISVSHRVSEEEARWRRKESTRQAKEQQKIAVAEATKNAKYENFLDQQMFELCEETAIILYPWVFLDDEGYQREKEHCPAYTELVREIFPQRFDVLEQIRIQLNEDIIENMFVESDVEVTDSLIEDLTQDKCMAMRLRCKPPPPEWPVPYPNECPEGTKRCPIRSINDVENYLRSLLEAQPSDQDDSILGTYLERHAHVYEPDEDNEDNFDVDRICPAVWFPPQARSKVHVYKTLFATYMERAHPYEEPIEPPGLCAFKFDTTKIGILQEAYETFGAAIENFGAFEFDDPPSARRVASSPEDFQNKVTYKTGAEIFVIVIRRINEEAFLAFAGNEPLFVTEDNDEAKRMIEEYFPAGAIDVIPEDPDEEEDFYEDYSDEEEDEEDEDEDEFENEGPDVPPSFVDLSMF